MQTILRTTRGIRPKRKSTFQLEGCDLLLPPIHSLVVAPSRTVDNVFDRDRLPVDCMPGRAVLCAVHMLGRAVLGVVRMSDPGGLGSGRMLDSGMLRADHTFFPEQ